jgi:hypothetical protein
MLKALMIKELRESIGLVVLAALALVYAFADLTGTQILPWQQRENSTLPFVYDASGFYLCVFIGGLAIVLGLKQTAWEARQGTFFFLLHRPIGRERVFASKLVVGLLLTMLLSAAIILIYASWATVPGHVPAPFEWSMTKPAWQYWCVMPVLYLGAFFAGIRPASWWGTRLAPVGAAIVCAVVAANIPWLWLTAVLSVLFCFLFLVAIFYYVGARDY